MGRQGKRDLLPNPKFFYKSLFVHITFLLPHTGHLLFFVLIKGFSNLGASAAEMVVTRKTLDDEDLLRNTSLVTIFDQAVKIFSPALAGIIAIRTEQSAAFLFSSISALAGGIFAFLLASHSSGIERYTAVYRSHGDFAALKILFCKNNIVLFFFVLLCRPLLWACMIPSWVYF